MKKKFLLITLILTLILSVFVACNDNSDNSSSDLGNGNSKYAILNDTYLQTDFENALIEISAEESKMSSLTKVEDWAGGSKYKFTYANKMTLYVYCNMTSTVDSINYGDEKIYYRGYESYNINNYVYDDSYEYTLVFASEDYVKLYLNYPSTAKFPASNSWSISRYNDIYMLSSWVKASNAFGVESQYDFTTGFYITEAEIKCIYLNIAGETKLNNINQYKPTTERKQVEPKYPNKNSNGNTDGINLVYGQLGTYGKNENDNGYSYIAYYVPSGRYTVINNGNMGTIFVSNNTDTRTYRFASGSTGETKEIVVPSGYYIELSMYTNITLQKIVENNNDSSTSSKPGSSDSENDGHNDIPYVVNHYIQNVDNEQYILYETENLKGTENSMISPAIKDYAGFTAPETQEVRIEKDGSLIVNYYYIRNNYTITFVTNGGTQIQEISQKYQSTLSLTKTERDGYTFGGWFIDLELNNLFSMPTMPAKDYILYAYWLEENKPSDFSYVGSSNLAISAYTGTSVNVWVPSYIGGLPVTNVLYTAFSENTQLQKVVMPSSVNQLDDAQFAGCSELKEVVFNLKITSIGHKAFYKCENLIKVNNSNEGEILLPNEIETIGQQAFGYCKAIKKITIPDSVKGISPSVFNGCYSLESISLPFIGTTENSIDRSAVFGIIFGGTIQGHPSAYQWCGNDGWEHFFMPASLKEVTITKQTKIPANAFYNCADIEKINLAPNTIEIGDCAFTGCSSLSKFNSNTAGELIIPFGMISIGNRAFDSYAYDYLSLIKNISIPDSVTFIGNKAFNGFTAPEEIVLPFVGNNIDSTESLHAVFGDIIPNTLKKITITKDTTIPDDAFAELTNVEKIELAINTTSIGATAFKNCRSLTEIFIPATVTSIGAYAFSGCFSLTIKYAGISIPPMWDIDWNKNGGTVEFIY